MTHYIPPDRSTVDFDLQSGYTTSSRTEVGFELSLSRRRSSETGEQDLVDIGRSGNDVRKIGRNKTDVEEI